MSIEKHARKALWMTAAMKALREITSGAEEICLSIGATFGGIQDAIWMIEADAGRRYEAATGVSLAVLKGGEQTDYHGVSEVIGYDEDEEDD
jgi:hypothetical protein